MAAKKGRREQQKVGRSNEEVKSEVKAEPKTSEQKDDKHRSDVIKTLLLPADIHVDSLLELVKTLGLNLKE